MPKVSVVIPCYFNELNIPLLAQALIANENEFHELTYFEYILIDDGSGDQTWREIQRFQAQFPGKVTGLKLANNVGSYRAIYAGLEKATGDCMVVMAADLQDPPFHIKQMFSQWRNGNNLVLANRLNPEGMAGFYFGFLRMFGLRNLPKGGFDFCLFSRELKEKFLKSLPKGANSLYFLLQLDDNPVLVPYEKRVREVGKSKWTTWRKVSLALCTIDTYASIRLIHISILLFLTAAFFLAVGAMVSARTKPLLIGFGVISLIVGLALEILRAVLRRKQRDLTIVVEQIA